MKWDNHISKWASILALICCEASNQQIYAAAWLIKMITSLRYLARQVEGVRGYVECEGNGIQIIWLRCDDVNGLEEWMGKRINMLSHDTQDDILKIMASNVLCGILIDVKRNEYVFFFLDETSYISTKEQLCTCLRHVDTNLEINEDFIGMFETDKSNAFRNSYVDKRRAYRLWYETEALQRSMVRYYGGSIEWRSRHHIKRKSKDGLFSPHGTLLEFKSSRQYSQNIIFMRDLQDYVITSPTLFVLQQSEWRHFKLFSRTSAKI